MPNSKADNLIVGIFTLFLVLKVFEPRKIAQKMTLKITPATNSTKTRKFNIDLSPLKGT